MGRMGRIGIMGNMGRKKAKRFSFSKVMEDMSFKGERCEGWEGEKKWEVIR